MKIDTNQINYFLTKQIDLDSRGELQLLAKGIPAGFGAVTGKIAFSASSVEQMSVNGEDSIIYCTEDPFSLERDHLFALRLAKGVIGLQSGNLYTGTAVICRGMGKPCVLSVKGLSFHKVAS